MKKILFILFFLFAFNYIHSQSVISEVDTPFEYDVVQVKPEFEGGLGKFLKFIMKNYQVPEVEEGEKVPSGDVKISFLIDVNGYVKNIRILKDIGVSGKEIKRVLMDCPKWKPGMQNSQNVPVMYNFVITIQ